MRERDGDGLFHCLRNGLRAIVKKPRELKDPETFQAWIIKSLKLKKSSFISFPPDKMQLVEDMINKAQDPGKPLVKINIISQVVHQSLIDTIPTTADDAEKVILPINISYNPETKAYFDQADMQGPKYWFETLKVNIGSHKSIPGTDIFIVGTHADSSDPQSRYLRMVEIQKLVDSVDLGLDVKSHYYEISCHTMTGINELREGILAAITQMPHMKEKIPKTYEVVMNTIRDINIRNSKFTTNISIEIYTMDQFLQSIPDTKENATAVALIKKDLVDYQASFHPQSLKTKAGDTNQQPSKQKTLLQRIFALLHLWGECVYFGDDPNLVDTVCFSVEFVTKKIMGSILAPRVSRKNMGLVSHRDFAAELLHKTDFSPSDEEDLKKAFGLLLKFNFCFVSPKASSASFLDQSTFVPALLTKSPDTDDIKEKWPSVMPPNFEFEKSLFVQLAPFMPLDVFHRALSLLFTQLQEGTNVDPLITPMWRFGAVLKSKLGQIVLFRTTQDSNSIEIRIRIQKPNEQDDANSNIIEGVDIMNKIVSIIENVSGAFAVITTSKYITVENGTSTCVFSVPSVSSKDHDQSCILKCSMPNYSSAEIRNLAGLEHIKPSRLYICLLFLRYPSFIPC